MGVVLLWKNTALVFKYLRLGLGLGFSFTDWCFGLEIKAWWCQLCDAGSFTYECPVDLSLFLLTSSFMLPCSLFLLIWTGRTSFLPPFATSRHCWRFTAILAIWVKTLWFIAPFQSVIQVIFEHRLNTLPEQTHAQKSDGWQVLFHLHACDLWLGKKDEPTKPCLSLLLLIFTPSYIKRAIDDCLRSEAKAGTSIIASFNTSFISTLRTAPISGFPDRQNYAKRTKWLMLAFK